MQIIIILYINDYIYYVNFERNIDVKFKSNVYDNK